MKKVLVCLLVLGLTLGFATFASAETQKGDKSFAGSVAYTHYDNGDSTWDLMSVLYLGYFFTDQMQLELTGVGMWGEDETTFGVLVRPNYHFNTQSNTVPYIGASLGLFFSKWEGESDTEFVYGAQVGIKQFVKENVFIQYELSYLKTEVEEEDINLFQATIGIGLKF